MFFILNILTSENQIKTTNKVLKPYQNILWAIENIDRDSMKKIERIIILVILRKSNKDTE